VAPTATLSAAALRRRPHDGCRLSFTPPAANIFFFFFSRRGMRFSRADVDAALWYGSFMHGR